MARRKRPQREGFLDILSELTGMFWQVGAVATFCFIILAVFAYRWAENIIAVAEASPLLTQIVATYGWLLYGLSIILFGFAFLFGSKSFNAFNQERIFRP